MIAWLRTLLQMRRRRRRAIKFNRFETFRGDGPGRWMCPHCNAVHTSTATSKFSGPQYPACCGHPAGGRLGRKFATLS